MTNAPEVTLIDAVTTGLDEERLREAARGVEAPFVSRSYRYPLALVASWSSDVGVDIERVDDALDLRFADSVATPRERAELEGATPADIASFWSAKEAIAKALGQPLARDPRRVEAPLAWRADAASRQQQRLGGPWWARALEMPDGYVGWLVWRGRPEPAAEARGGA